MSDVELAIRMTGDADDAVRAANDVGDAFDRAAQDVDDATSRMDDSGGRMDAVGESADNMASRSAQAAGGIGDLAGALAATGVVSEETAGAMELGSTAIMGVTGASDLLNLAMTSTAVTTAKAKAAAIAHATATKVQAAATKAMAIAQRILNVAMRANPIGLIITAILAVVAGLILAYKKSATFRAIVNTVMRAVRGYINAVVTILKRVWEFFRDDLPAAAKVMRDKVAEAWQWIKDKAGAAWDWVRDKVRDVVTSIKDRVLSIKDKVADVGRKVREAIGGAFSWVKGKVEDVIELVQDIIDKVTSIKLPSLPDLNPLNGRMALGGRPSAGADYYTPTGGDTYVDVSIDAGMLTSEAELGATLATTLDRYMRQRGRDPVFA